MEKHILSKTSYIKGLQCSKALFLYRHYPQLRDPIPPERQAQFTRGIDVGILARELFPGGIDSTVGLSRKYEQAVEKTRDLIEGGTDVIYEAAFRFNGVLIFVDILARSGNGWHAVEVKSSLRLSPVHVNDAALQYYVLKGAGLEITNFSLAHINSAYRREGDVQLNKLFNLVSVLEEIEQKEKQIALNVGEMKTMLEGSQVPARDIGDHCFSPYSCDFIGQCWKPLPEHNIFELTGLSRSDAFLLYSSGIQSITDIVNEDSLNEMARAQLRSLREMKPLVDKAKLDKFFSGLKFPLLFMDIETFMPAIPKYEGTKPFQHLPFQYSIHAVEQEGAEAVHISFIAEPGNDPRKEFAESILRDTEGTGSIIVYDSNLERSMLFAMKNLFPEYGDAFLDRISRLTDLMQPFMERAYHHPAMKGSVSLKNVLPALVPGMSYTQLKIANGSQAMAAYEQLHDQQDLFTLAEMKEGLFEYGRLDTLAMVHIMDVLRKAKE
ncbi:MAG: hypothetical protein FD123_1412 [Bacteroidetes bacterium]|nr:MAG: hypothetical protein FD123_1412 [Bacteroidota bacterium]